MMSETVVTYAPRGVARDLFTCKDSQLVLSGPAGTGKSRACLEKVHLCASKYAGMRALIARKTRTSLTQTALVTFDKAVLHPLDGVDFHHQDQEYRYPNGSILVVGGLDKPTKIMSSEYDMIYIQEATELTEDDWESLTTRLRNGVMPYQQLLADCNPDAPGHWLRQRALAGTTLMLESRHEDNPRLYQGGAWTEDGTTYIEILDKLTGARLHRLRYGRWVSAEGAVYDDFDHAVHVVDRFEIPYGWRRLRVVDFGYTNPFVCQWWAIDPDGRAYLYRELYQTQRIVADHARQILALSAGEPIAATIADHDAEDRATLHAMGIQTIPAYKAIGPGIQAVQQRLRPAGNGLPRLFVMRDSLVARDESLDARKKPLCSEQEVDVYMWPKTLDGKPLKEVPLDMDNHGMDCWRYLVAYVDELGGSAISAIDAELHAALSGFTGM